MFLTFAALAEGLETAPGQPTVHALRHTHRFDSIGPATRVYGIAGWPVEASMSPQVHNAGFDSIDFDGAYLRLPIPPEWEHFKATINSFLDHDGLDFSGMSVTMPHKEHLVRLVLEREGVLDEVSAISGAANTLVVGEDGALMALNTDAPAAIDTLVEAMGSTTADLRGRSVAVIGAGGVARAICAGLLQHGACVTVFNRTETRGRRMVDDLAERIPDARIELGTGDSLSTESFEAYINCTSVGSPDGSDPESSPLPEEVVLDGDVVVFDTIHSAEPTPLLRRAREDGARIATGRAMFIRQAELQFEAWTGVRPAAGLFASTLASD